MAAGIFIGAQPQFFDSSGNPVALGSLTFYKTGTTTFKKTYKEVALTNENDNPMDLNAAGRPEFAIYGTGAYKFILKNSAGVQVGDTQDPVYFTGNPSGIGNGTITSAMIQDGAIVAGDIAAATITGAKIAVGTITSANIQNATIQGADIAAATIAGSNIALLTVDTGNITAAAITTAKIDDLQVTTDKLNNLAVTTGKLGALSVTTAKIGALQVTADEIANATITGAKIGNLEVKTANIDNLAVTSGKIGTSEVKAGNIEDGAVTSGKIGNLQVTAGKIGNLEITAAQIANLTITGGPGGKIATSTITDDNIVAKAISAASIAAGTITVDELAANSVVASKILADTIRASHIDVGLFLTFPSDENFIGYWSFDDGTGSVAVDNSGGGNNGAITGSSWATGYVGKCIKVETGNVEINVSASAPLAFVFWFQVTTATDDVGDGSVLFKLYEDGTNYIELETYNNQPYIDSTGYVQQHTHKTYNFLADQWYMGVFKLSSTNATFEAWKDGEIVETWSDDDAGYASYNFTKLYLYDFGSNCYWDEVRLYDYILTSSETKALFLFPSGNESGVISGQSIAANTITASEINGAGFGTLTITSGKIVINTANALEIQAGGNVLIKDGSNMTLEVGGDLIFGLSDADPSLLNWGNAYYGGAASTAARGLSFWPHTAGIGRFGIGWDPINNIQKAFDNVKIYAEEDALLSCADGTDHSYCDVGPDYLQLKQYLDAGGVSYITMQGNIIGLTASYVQPSTDSAYRLGHPDLCWLNIYGDAGVTSCSDKKWKVNVEESSLGLDFIKQLEIISWEWDKDKGKNLSNKFHGVLAQDVLQTLEDMGYTHDDFGGIEINDVLDEETGKVTGENWGFRYEQLIGPLCKAVQELSAEITELKKLH